MVGEMRDRDTAEIGIQAALTGHLVLTTLHTNSASEAVIRLVDLGVDTFLLRSALRCVVAQRLVRSLCLHCRQRTDEPSQAAAALIESGRFAPQPGDQYYVRVGCNWCGGTGFRGRLGIFEVIKLDQAIRGLIKGDVDPMAIDEAARRQGTTTMLEDGLSKYRRGITTVEEVLRATI